ncbi:hypothetical protein EV121DRAFT_297238, partial [Schizophyllum commune]
MLSIPFTRQTRVDHSPSQPYLSIETGVQNAQGRPSVVGHEAQGLSSSDRSSGSSHSLSQAERCQTTAWTASALGQSWTRAAPHRPLNVIHSSGDHDAPPSPPPTLESVPAYAVHERAPAERRPTDLFPDAEPPADLPSDEKPPADHFPNAEPPTEPWGTSALRPVPSVSPGPPICDILGPQSPRTSTPRISPPPLGAPRRDSTRDSFVDELTRSTLRHALERHLAERIAIDADGRYTTQSFPGPSSASRRVLLGPLLELYRDDD